MRRYWCRFLWCRPGKADAHCAGGHFTASRAVKAWNEGEPVPIRTQLFFAEPEGAVWYEPEINLAVGDGEWSTLTMKQARRLMADLDRWLSLARDLTATEKTKLMHTHTIAQFARRCELCEQAERSRLAFLTDHLAPEAGR